MFRFWCGKVADVEQKLINQTMNGNSIEEKRIGMNKRILLYCICYANISYVHMVDDVDSANVEESVYTN